MPRKRKPQFNYNEVVIRGHKYLKTYVQDLDGRQVILYGKTLDELCKKVDEANANLQNNEQVRQVRP